MKKITQVVRRPLYYKKGVYPGVAPGLSSPQWVEEESTYDMYRYVRIDKISTTPHASQSTTCNTQLI